MPQKYYLQLIQPELSPNINIVLGLILTLISCLLILTIMAIFPIAFIGTNTVMIAITIVVKSSDLLSSSLLFLIP